MKGGFAPVVACRWQSMAVSGSALFSGNRERTLPGGLQGIGTDPEIRLEVENRTLRVCQRTCMSARRKQLPGNGWSHCRNDLFPVARFQRAEAGALPSNGPHGRHQ